MIKGVSLAVPVRDEAESISQLVESIHRQLRKPDEVIFVDGGSRDGTLDILQAACDRDPSFRLIRAGQALPGQGRNIGVANAVHDWIAFTDAGIKLEPDWLQQLIAAAESDGESGIICGNFEPVTDSFFKQCAVVAYVPDKIVRDGQLVRHPFIASSMVRRDVWHAAGGFPDLRAAEDLIFFEDVENKGFQFKYAPGATVHWEVQPNLANTFRRFFLYSCVNVWAGRQRYWHYGVLRWYLLALPFVVLAIWKSPWWLLLPLAGLGARIAGRIWHNRAGHSVGWMMNPMRFAYVMVITLVLDAATFGGWIKALFKRGEAAKIAEQMRHRHGD